MKDKINQLFRTIYKLKDKIAFYPSIIGLAGCLFAYLMFFLENLGISKYLLEIVPELVINNSETARALLTTFIAGLISIMVFSFSMVMILLNQASSNFSPRLLPGLISNRRHQIVLGFYLATILYCIFILVSIEPDGNKYQLPGFSVLFSIIFMVNCLAAFIYFIHSISQEIQISNIMSKIFKVSKSRLEKLIDLEKDLETEAFKDTSNWTTYTPKNNGYLQDISIDNIGRIAHELKTKIEVLPIKGTFILKEDSLFKSEKELDNDKVELILKHFDFAKSELIEDNYILAFKQLTEIALKAMSPGINDPGTALNAIDYLTQLFVLRCKKSDTSLYKYEEITNVALATVSFKDLLYYVMAALRTYCKHDVILVTKLHKMLTDLKKVCTNSNYNTCIANEIDALVEDAKSAVDNERDVKFINAL
ncbi:DUF2254 domain-containing protein [Lacinutrix sp. MedPE-SW]|mgnify:CR=1 FL=1|uniref:DUF2254 domain-containing protein n=1 Tax=Lacinutrix sp. MedPE-SW TaxID=1860087 RepID=UPI000923A9E8|nr:DUF2254 domain-containing protein [Lacinutrix sp. MedPE-SW]OIQ16976.1 MAG: hypothetical protein BM549_12970 [Lacinutrix sp. MedPE-SW]